MSVAMQIALWIQIGLALFWNFAYLSAGGSDWGILFFFFAVFIAHAPLFLFAAWTFWKHIDLRRMAGWAMAIPFISLASSLVLRNLIGGALSERSIVLILFSLIVGAIVFCFARPKVATRLIPQALVRSRGVNITLIVLQGLSWLLPVVLFLIVMAENAGKTISSSGNGMGLAYVMIAVAIYLVSVGAFSLLVAVFAWVGLRGSIADTHRRLHITQLALAAPAFLLGIAALTMLFNMTYLS